MAFSSYFRYRTRRPGIEARGETIGASPDRSRSAELVIFEDASRSKGLSDEFLVVSIPLVFRAESTDVARGCHISVCGTNAWYAVC